LSKVILDRNKLADEMYKTSSDLLHSNSALLNDYMFKDILELRMKKYMDTLGTPFVIKTFFDVFHESNYFEVSVFLKIAESALDEYYQYKLNIR
jgi:hypothetical protein